MADKNDFQTASAWRAEVDRSERVAKPLWTDWETNLNYYVGKSPDAQDANAAGNDWVNVNADFYTAELKQAQLFFDTPDLTLAARGEFKAPPPAAPIPGAPPQPAPSAGPIVEAHRALLNELLGPDFADVLSTVQKAIKDCLVTAGCGATKICYHAAMAPLPEPQLDPLTGQPMPEPGLAVPLPAAAPIDEQWLWERIPSKKFRIPADFRDTDFDKAPWLGMDFRMPVAQARREYNLPPDYEGTKDRDEKVLNDKSTNNQDASGVPYVDGTEIWYYANIFDGDVVNPKVIRRHVIIEGVDTFVEKTTENPYQRVLPNGKLSADSMIGFPIHVLTLRDVPDSAFVPSDSTMMRPLVRELCKFRTQQVQERDANLPRFLVDVEKLPPDAQDRIQNGTIGSMIPVMSDALAQGVDKIMAQVSQASQTRGSYTANDYIQRDLDKTTGIDAVGAGVKDQEAATATEISVIDKQRNVRIDAERRRVLQWYLKGVAKFSAVVARYMSPELAATIIGQQGAQAWAGWDRQTWDGRFVFDAKPDSQIKLDAASERKFALDLYQFLRKDPNVNGTVLLKNLSEKSNMDPNELVVDQLPPKHEDPNVNVAVKGEDFVGPQSAAIIAILAQLGIQIPQEAINAIHAANFFNNALGIQPPPGKAPQAQQPPAEHGGVVEKVRPLNQQSADHAGQRPGAKPLA